MANDYVVKPVYKALQVLQLLGEERREMSLTEVAYRVGLPKTTVFRYLYTLDACGFVVHDPETDLYRLGFRIWELGQLEEKWLRIREVALPRMEELRNHFNETVNLGVVDGTEIVYLEMVESRRSLRMQARLGSRDPIYTTALGKAMLAFMPPEQWSTHLPPQLVPRTSRTETTLVELHKSLAQARELGFAIDHGVKEEDSCCIGAPIFDHRRVVIAAVSLSAPATRLPRRMERQAATMVMQTAHAISLRLGYPDEAQQSVPPGGADLDRAVDTPLR